MFMKNKSKYINNIRKNRTMSQELILGFGLVFICFGIFIGVVLFFMIKGALYQEKENLLESRVHNIPIESLIKISSNEALLDNANSLMNEVVDLQIQCAVINSKGEIVAKVGSDTLNRLKERLLLDEQPYLESLNDLPVFTKSFYEQMISRKGFGDFQLSKNREGISFMSYFLKIGDLNNSTGMIQMSTDLTAVNRIIRNQMIIYAVLSLIMLVIVLNLIWFITRRTLLPLNKMQKIINKFKVNLEAMDSKGSSELFQGHKDLNLLKGQAEVLNLAKSYDEMLTAIQKAFNREEMIKNQMRQFVSDASHELRTPLTSIRGFAEVLELGAYNNPDQLVEGLKSIVSESERMEILVSNLLTLNRLDQNRLSNQDITVSFGKINLHALLKEMHPQLVILAKNRSIKCEIDQMIAIKGQLNGLKQVVLNLFQNAVQHTSPDWGDIQISASQSEEHIKICIRDNGKGIQPESLPKVFDRFYRGEAHRSREEGGYGLGLAIVKSIVEQHQGDITVDSIIEEGTTFTIILPRYSDFLSDSRNNSDI